MNKVDKAAVLKIVVGYLKPVSKLRSPLINLPGKNFNRWFMGSRPKTINEVSILLDNNVQLPIVIGDFLDEFRSSPRFEYLNEEPKLLKDSVLNAYLAAVAECLAIEFDFEPPLWTQGPERFLSEWYYAGNTKHLNLQLLLQEEAPIPFRNRKLGVSANVLSRF